MPIGLCVWTCSWIYPGSGQSWWTCLPPTSTTIFLYIFLSGSGPNGGKNGRNASTVVQSGSVILPSFCPCPSGVHQAATVSEHQNEPLFAPFWPQKPWFPDLLSLLLEVPISLLQRTDVLKQSHFHHHHQSLHVLQLTAWSLSSIPHVPWGSMRRWLYSLHYAVKNHKCKLSV